MCVAIIGILVILAANPNRAPLSTTHNRSHLSSCNKGPQSPDSLSGVGSGNFAYNNAVTKAAALTHKKLARKPYRSTTRPRGGAPSARPEAATPGPPASTEEVATLDKAHILDDVVLSVWYWSWTSWTPQYYEGPEEDFDRSKVFDIISEERITQQDASKPTPDWLAKWTETVRWMKEQHEAAGTAGVR